MTAQSFTEKLEQATSIRDAWKRYAPDKLMANMTQEQFVARVAKSTHVLVRVKDLEAQLEGARNDRETEFDDLSELIQYIKNAIAGDPTLGPDSSFYEAAGYVRKSDRKSGLRRGKKSDDDKD